jgi:hypothetical protein
VLSRYSKHHDGAKDGKSGDKCYGKAFALESCSSPARAKDSYDLNRTKWNIEEDGLEIGVAEVFNDKIAESRDSAACYPSDAPVEAR